ncbi:uncharacterized protein cxcl11.5 [Scophthalmus maximus]|nr:uncharacterized protein cxcl11.5 [Scophthalmus maximus]
MWLVCGATNNNPSVIAHNYINSVKSVGVHRLAINASRHGGPFSGKKRCDLHFRATVLHRSHSACQEGQQGGCFPVHKRGKQTHVLCFHLESRLKEDTAGRARAGLQSQTMNSAVVAFLSSLLVLCAQGDPGNRSQKCKCLNGFIGRVTPHLIKSEPVIHQPNIFCPQLEIIITLTGNKEKCVNPLSPFGKLLLKNQKKNESKAAVVMTTASSQTNTWSSTRLRSTHSAPRTM